MLRNLNIRNFRAYKQESFDFSKINIFMGPNNSGKSSALSAINLLAQTAQNYMSLSSPLQLNGEFEQLGTFLDVAHGNTSRTTIGFDFEIDDQSVSIDVKYRPQRREIYISKFSLQSQNKPVFSYVEKKDSFSSKFLGRSSELLNPKFHRRPRFAGFWPQNRYIFGMDNVSPAEQEQYRLFSRAMRSSERKIMDTFANYDSLSPFREQPQRTYIYTGEAPEHIGRTGGNGVSLLVNDEGRKGARRTGFLQEIDRWLQVTGIAKGIRVKNLTPRHFEMCIVDFNGREQNICDVGFGCSQVLPVLAGGLHAASRRPAYGSIQPIYVVQEPEIHLHPNAQAALGSFFVGLANQGTQQFIETHSDHMVLRIARHVARGDISAEDIRLYFVETISGERVVHRMSFDKSGAFHPEWPGGFLPQRKTESLAIARDRLRIDEIGDQLAFPYL